MSNVLRISEAASLALHGMVYLAAEPEGAVRVSDMAKLLGVSENSLKKVFPRLARAGLVKAVRGPHGGYMLSRPGHSISLRKVYEAIEGPLKAVSCLLGAPVCRGDKCVLGDMLERVNAEVREYLDYTVLTDLISVYQKAEK
jgi:Rrf2 family protein